MLYEVDAANQTKTYHYDRRGSTVAITSQDGHTITDTWQYGPYGERLARTGTTDTPFQFNGFFGVQTDSNGLLYMNARYYNTELRRFVSPDPMGFGAGSNFYAFADGDPIDLADPFGLSTADTSKGGWLSSALESLGNLITDEWEYESDINVGIDRRQKFLKELPFSKRWKYEQPLVPRDWLKQPGHHKLEIGVAVAESILFRRMMGSGTPVGNTIPRGFASAGQFSQASTELQMALTESGITDASIGVRGSSVTGFSYRTGQPFGPASDIDFFAESGQLTQGLRTSQNIPGFVNPNLINSTYSPIAEWSEIWSENLGRKVGLGGFQPGSVPAGPVMRP